MTAKERRELAKEIADTFISVIPSEYGLSRLVGYCEAGEFGMHGYIVQDKPYTLFLMTGANNNGDFFRAAGFSKVCYPDKWDARYGIELAIRKAAAKAARQIAEAQ